MHICCIIKPPSITLHATIRLHLRREGIETIAQRNFVYTSYAIDVLYDHMDVAARIFITQRYEGKIGLALLVNFISIQHCLDCIGRESDPYACDPHSIRALYCHSAKPEMLDTFLWWENGIHRPVDERERVRDIALVFPEFQEGAA